MSSLVVESNSTTHDCGLLTADSDLSFPTIDLWVMIQNWLITVDFGMDLTENTSSKNSSIVQWHVKGAGD
jgi:hypothetical protein